MKADAKIPTRLVAPIVKDYLENYKTYRHTLKFRPSMTNSWALPTGATGYISPKAALAARMGSEYHIVDRIVNEKYEYTEFNRVDRVFCAMDRPFAWLDGGELEKEYYAADISENSHRRMENLPDGRRLCANIECNTVFEVEGQKTKVYCGRKCKDQAEYRRRKAKSAKA